MNNIQFIQTTPNQLAELIDEKVKISLSALRDELLNKNSNDELLTRTQACEFLQIEQTTLYHWTNAGKVIAYGIGNRRYYKRSELLDSLRQLKK
jgi:hypothetical protein